MKTSDIIKQTSLPKFPFDGNYLKDKGVEEGAKMGKVLKLLKNEWLSNDFRISDQKISQIINNHNN